MAFTDMYIYSKVTGYFYHILSWTYLYIIIRS